MRRAFFVTSLVLCTILLSAILPSDAHADKTLDGKTYTGEVGKKGDTKGDADTFIFSGGKFDSTACHEYGFGDATYKAKPEGDATAFEATTVNDKGNKIQWKGTIHGDVIQGDATMVTDKGEPEDHMWFKGTIKK